MKGINAQKGINKKMKRSTDICGMKWNEEMSILRRDGGQIV